MKYQNPNIESSYRDNDIGRTFYDFVLEHKPKKIIEFGALYGYSTVAMAQALDEIGEGQIKVYDLFEDYARTHSAHKHTDTLLALRGGLPYYIDMVRQDWKDWFKSRGHQITQKEVQDNVNRYGLSKYVSIEKKDFMNWIKNPEPFDLLHVDISNNGDIIKILADAVRPHIDAGAHVIFEGGSLERDTIEWMKRYNKKRITDSGVVYVQLNEKFPSLSLIT